MYIVYQRTSPSGHSYIGYTSLTLMERWKHTVNELRNKSTPLAHAIRKYGPDSWQHQVLFETHDEKEAHDMEIKLIAELGHYNLAQGGNGGNTGRNHEPAKRKKQGQAISNHWKSLDIDEKSRRIRKSIESRIKNGTLGNNNPQYAEKHGKWSGYWFINGTPYKTSKEAAKMSGLNESTVIDLCVHHTDKVYKRSSPYVEKGKTPRQCGYYKGNL